MFKVLRYSFLDLIRSRWTVIYFLFFLLACGGLLYLSGDSTKAVVSMMNIIILLVPLISTIFGLMYMYQVRDYVEILLAQPLSRKSIFSGYFLGLGLALSLSMTAGMVIPVLVFNPLELIHGSWLLLILISVLLTFIFTAIACMLVLRYDNRLKGFGIGLFIWLLLAVLYDGVFLVLLVSFQEYPLEKLALSLTVLNPIDMGRVLLIFQLDYSALMGYTGAVFEKFFGTLSGSLVIAGAFVVWLFLPVWGLLRLARRKDF